MPTATATIAACTVSALGTDLALPGAEVPVKEFPTNIHDVERLARMVAGAAMLSLLAIGPLPGWGLFGLLGFIPLLTGFSGTCPIYLAAGTGTAPRH